MRISDWSSDVCSSDLLAAALDVRNRPREEIRERIEDVGRHLVHRMERYLNTLGTIAAAGPLLGLFGTVVGMIQMFLGILDHGVGDVNQLAGGIGKALVCTAAGMIVAIPALMFRSEEHTSELQSLMRTSYAVFCLKKK